MESTSSEMGFIFFKVYEDIFGARFLENNKILKRVVYKWHLSKNGMFSFQEPYAWYTQRLWWISLNPKPEVMCFIDFSALVHIYFQNSIIFHLQTFLLPRTSGPFALQKKWSLTPVVSGHYWCWTLLFWRRLLWCPTKSAGKYQKLTIFLAWRNIRMTPRHIKTKPIRKFHPI